MNSLLQRLLPAHVRSVVISLALAAAVLAPAAHQAVTTAGSNWN